HEAHFVDFCSHMNVFRWVVPVAAEDRVGYGFGERHRHVQRDLTRRVPHRLAFTTDEVADTLDERHIAGDFELDHADFRRRRRAGPVRIEGRGHSVNHKTTGTGEKRLDDPRSCRCPSQVGKQFGPAQKLWSARSRVSAIWNSVSSLVSSNSVFRSSFRFASRSSPPCSRIFFDSETKTPRPELSM